MGEKSYYLEGVDEELWEEWTNSFPREVSIEERLIELIRADANGQV